MSKKNKKIIISGYYGFGNLGDEAILTSIVERLNEELDNPRIVVLSNSKKTHISEKYNVKCVGRLSILGIISELAKADLFISGGGGLLQDSTGFATVAYYLSVVRIAQLMKKKILFYAQGIGPVTCDKSKSLISRIVSKVDFITIRDEESLKLLKDLNVNNKHMLVTADPVIALKQPSDEYMDDFIKKNMPDFKQSQGMNIAFSVRPWISTNDYISVIAKSADALVEKYNANIYLIPFQISQDYLVCCEIAKKMKSKSEMIMPSMEEKLLFQYSPQEMSGIIGRMDLLIGMRLHSLIFASASNTPSAGIIYDPKVRIFAESAGMQAWNLDSLSVDNILDFALKYAENKDEFRKSIKSKTDKLYELSRLTGKIAAELANGESPDVIFDKYGASK